MQFTIYLHQYQNVSPILVNSLWAFIILAMEYENWILYADCVQCLLHEDGKACKRWTLLMKVAGHFIDNQFVNGCLHYMSVICML